MLITFDDGYRDNLDNAAPVLRKHGYPAVLFVPIGYLDDRRPLPHEEHLARARHPQPHDRVGGAGGARARAASAIESHGISHRPLADLEVDEAAREIALSKLRLEERLGRPVRAFSYVKGSRGALQARASEPRAAGGVRRRLHGGLGRERSERPIRCSSAATTSSRTLRGRSSSSWPAPAT